MLVLIQFIRPGNNVAAGPSPNSIDKYYSAPGDVKAILKRSCYDCHSNNTYYPWYNAIQPVAWLLAHDVTEGKAHLNFDEFATYNASKKQHKLANLIDEIKEDEMPMGIYTMIHRNAVLSAVEKQRLTHWVDSLKKAIK